MARNKLMDLNNHLFEQLERLNDESLSDEGLEKEVVRVKAMSVVSRNIIENAKLSLDAEKFKAEYGGKEVAVPKMIDG